MALPVFPANVADSYNMLRNSANNTQSYLTQVRADIASGSVTGFYLLTALGAAVTTLQNAQAVSADVALADAMGSYVRMMVGDQTLDVHAELTASMAALTQVVGAMVSEYPKEQDGYLRDRKFDAQGIVEWDVIPSSSLTATNAAITAWLATIV